MAGEVPKNTLHFWGGIHSKDYQRGVRKELQSDEVKDRWVKAILENAPEMVRMARLTASEKGSSAVFRQDDAEHMDSADASFDAVHIRDVIWNSYDPEMILSEAYRVLSPNGILMIVDSNCQRDISEWSAEHPDSETLRECRRRDLGLGAYDVIDEYYSELPLNDVQRPQWDVDAIERMGMEIVSCGPFDDPLLEDDLKRVFDDRFMIVARKNRS